jgi:hypothetical protein
LAGVTERLGSRSVVDPAGINSLAGIAETDDVVREAANKVGLQRLFPDLDRMQPNGGTLISVLREAAAKLGLECLLPADQTRRKDSILISMLRRVEQAPWQVSGPIPARFGGIKKFWILRRSSRLPRPAPRCQGASPRKRGGIPTCVPQKSVDRNPCYSAARAPNRLS